MIQIRIQQLCTCSARPSTNLLSMHCHDVDKNPTALYLFCTALNESSLHALSCALTADGCTAHVLISVLISDLRQISLWMCVASQHRSPDSMHAAGFCQKVITCWPMSCLKRKRFFSPQSHARHTDTQL